jgi:hypothetical protein
MHTSDREIAQASLINDSKTGSYVRGNTYLTHLHNEKYLAEGPDKTGIPCLLVGVPTQAPWGKKKSEDNNLFYSKI